MSHTVEPAAIRFSPPVAPPAPRARRARVSRVGAAALVIASLALAKPAAAQEAHADAPRYSAAWHGGIAAIAVLGSGLVLRLDRWQTPACRWCGVDGSGQPRVPRIDAWAHRQWQWQNERRAATSSHVTVSATYAWPLIGLAAVHGGVNGAMGRDVTAVMSSLAVTQLVTDTTKRIVRRSRPHVVFDADPVDGPGDVHSYFSGHTASAFAAVVSTATIASRRRSGHARWIWLGGLGLSSATGYLRIAGNRHYLTDVLSGAVVGSAVGLLMPQLFDGQADAGLSQAATHLPIAGLGPVAAVGPGRALRLQFGAGPGGFGLLGAVSLR